MTELWNDISGSVKLLVLMLVIYAILQMTNKIR